MAKSKRNQNFLQQAKLDYNSEEHFSPEKIEKIRKDYIEKQKQRKRNSE